MWWWAWRHEELFETDVVSGLHGLENILDQRTGKRRVGLGSPGTQGPAGANGYVLKGYNGLQLSGLPALEDIAYRPGGWEADESITLVSAALEIGRKVHTGFSVDNYSFEADYIQRLNHLLDFGMPTEVIVQSKYSKMLKVRERQRVRALEVEELRRAFTRFDKVQQIRQKPAWLQQANWLPDSPQAYAADYNPLVMSKLYWLADVCERNPFDTKYFVWLDAGICTLTMISPNNLDKLQNRMRSYMRNGRFWVCHAPYPGGSEIHGFSRPDIDQYAAGKRVEVVPKGGMFGGTCSAIKRALVAYDDALVRSLDEGYMGTEESIFAILHYTHPHLFEPCSNSVGTAPGQETLCQFLDDNYAGFGEHHQVRFRSSTRFAGRDGDDG